MKNSQTETICCIHRIKFAYKLLVIGFCRSPEKERIVSAINYRPLPIADFLTCVSPRRGRAVVCHDYREEKCSDFLQICSDFLQILPAQTAIVTD